MTRCALYTSFVFVCAFHGRFHSRASVDSLVLARCRGGSKCHGKCEAFRMSFFCRTVEAQKMSGCMALDIDIHSPYSAKIFPCELTVAQHVERSTKGSAERQVISMTLSPQSYRVLETLDPGHPNLFLCNRIDINMEMDCIILL